VTIIRMSHAEWRAFLRTWTGGVDPDDERCKFRVLTGSRRPPKLLGMELIEVGDVWLQHSAIPRAALEEKCTP
jgi:hypothetical protein